MRTVNALLVPMPDSVDEFLLIKFPECQVSIQELANCPNAEIALKVGTHSDPFLYIDSKPEGLIIKEEYTVKSLRSAIDHYGVITKT